MAVITSAILGAGALAYGAYNYMEGREDQEEGLAMQQAGIRRQQEGAQKQYELELEKSASSKLFAAQDFNQKKAAADHSKVVAGQSQTINTGILDTQFKMEEQRQQAMRMDAKRQQLEIIRNQQRARSLALTNATAQGARQGSGLQGGYGQIAGQSNNSQLANRQNLQFGENIFTLNAQLTGQRKQMVDLETQYAYARADQQTAQAQMMFNYANVNADFQTRASDIQTNYMSSGQGMIAQGQGIYGLGASQSAFGGQLMQLGMNLPGYGQTLSNVGSSLGSTMSGFNMANLGFNPVGLRGSYA